MLFVGDSSYKGISCEVLPIHWSDFCSWRKIPFDQMILLLRGSANWFALVRAKTWADRGSPVCGSWSHLAATLVQRQCSCRWWVCKQMWLSICSQGEQAMQDLTRFLPCCQCLHHFAWSRTTASLASSGFGDFVMKDCWRDQTLGEGYS